MRQQPGNEFGHDARAMTTWIDTHCHLDAPEFEADRLAMRERARQAGVSCCLSPAVQTCSFASVRALAHAHGDVYALGIHPMYTRQELDSAIDALDAALAQHTQDAQLVALGEIGLDGFAPGLDWARQEWFLRKQLRLARRYDLPVILHVRHAVDAVLRQLRELPVAGGIVHAFSGSLQQAQAFIRLGFKLGFGGALTFERAQRLRRLAAQLPLDAMVLETDAPDIAPQWLYKSAAQRAQGQPQSRNEPAQLPRIAQVLAALRGLSMDELAQANARNACAALPRLANWLGAAREARA